VKKFALSLPLVFLILWSILWPGAASAAKFANAYIEFELPLRWQCRAEKFDWICQKDGAKRDAIVIFTAKKRTEDESVEAFHDFLLKPRAVTGPDGAAAGESAVRLVERREIKGHPWVDALHMASEIPGFYTRYLATVKSDISVLMTISVRGEHFAAYAKEFYDLLASVKVFDAAPAASAAPAVAAA
jgi:hypothetical protein